MLNVKLNRYVLNRAYYLQNNGILESPVLTPLSNRQTFVHIELLFLVENISY